MVAFGNGWASHPFEQEALRDGARSPGSARTCAEFVRSLATAFGDRPAVVLGGEVLTYRDLEERSRALAQGLLARGVGKGCRVGLLFENSPSWVVYWAAVTRIGAVAVPLSTFSKPPELARVVRHGDLQGVVTQRSFLGQDFVGILEQGINALATSPPDLLLPTVPFLRWIVVDDIDSPTWARPPAWVTDAGSRATSLVEEAEAELCPDEPAMMIYTSGQSATPKGVWHSHASVMGKTHYLREMMCRTRGMHSDATMPFFWVGGLVMDLLTVLEVGGQVHCNGAPTSGGTVIGAVGSGRSTVTYGPHFPGLGMSETFGMYAWGTVAPHPERPICPPMTVFDPEIEVKVLDPEGNPVSDGGTGEMVVRGNGVTLGLQKVARQDAFHADGFYRTGDECLVEGGAVYFLGRLGDMIKTAGANVAPAEVERELVAIDGVVRAHVVGIPDRDRGHIVGAAVVADGAVPLDAAMLAERLRTRLATYKIPRLIAFVDLHEIPTTPSNKIRRSELAALILARGARARQRPTGDDAGLGPLNRGGK